MYIYNQLTIGDDDRVLVCEEGWLLVPVVSLNIRRPHLGRGQADVFNLENTRPCRIIIIPDIRRYLTNLSIFYHVVPDQEPIGPPKVQPQNCCYGIFFYVDIFYSLKSHSK